MQPTIAPPAGPIALTPAEPGNRLVAYLIDMAPFVLAMIPCLGFILLLPLLAYMICRELIFDGRSFGKKTMKLRVVDATTGQRPPSSTLILRHLILLIPFFPLVELIVMLTNPQRRRFGDQWFNTVVVPSES